MASTPTNTTFEFFNTVTSFMAMFFIVETNLSCTGFGFMTSSITFPAGRLFISVIESNKATAEPEK